MPWPWELLEGLEVPGRGSQALGHFTPGGCAAGCRLPGVSTFLSVGPEDVRFHGSPRGPQRSWLWSLMALAEAAQTHLEAPGSKRCSPLCALVKGEPDVCLPLALALFHGSPGSGCQMPPAQAPAQAPAPGAVAPLPFLW